MAGEIIRYTGGTDFKWMKWGLCNRANPNSANPEGIDFSQPEDDVSAQKAIDICNTPCPVRDDCLGYALQNNITQGVMGGTSEAERKVLNKKHKQSVKAQKKNL